MWGLCVRRQKAARGPLMAEPPFNLKKGFAAWNKPLFHHFISVVLHNRHETLRRAYCQPSVPYSATLSALIMKVSMG